MLAQVIRNTRTAPIPRTRLALVLAAAENCSSIPSTRTAQSLFVSGYALARRAAIVVISARALASDTPGRKRPTTWRVPSSRVLSRGSAIRGIQNLPPPARTGEWNPRGITPMIVVSAPPTRILRPITSRRAPKSIRSAVAQNRNRRRRGLKVIRGEGAALGRRDPEQWEIAFRDSLMPQPRRLCPQCHVNLAICQAARSWKTVF